MRQVWTVASFTFLETVRKKAFVVTCIVFVVIIAAVCLFMPNLSTSGMEDVANDLNSGILSNTEVATCYIYSEDQELGNLCTTIVSKEKIFAKVEQLPADDTKQLLAISNSLATDKTAILVQVQPAEWVGNVVVQVKDAISGSAAAQAAYDTINRGLKENALNELGVDPVMSDSILRREMGFSVQAMGQDPMGNMFFSIVLMMIMFISIYYLGYATAMSVATEKSSRIMETLIVSAKPKNVLYGKVIGSGLVGLCQLCGLLLVAVGMLKFAVPESSLFNAPQLSAGQIALVIVYFILGYTLFSFIQSVSGALVSKIEDMQQAMMPAAMLVVICFYAGYFPGIMSYSTGNGGAASPFLLLLPFTAPFSVVGQILSDEPLKPSILIASLALLIAAIFIVGFICAKIYAASVLHYGARLRIKDLRKLIRNK